MTISNPAHTRALFLAISLSGSMLSACQSAETPPTAESSESTENGGPSSNASNAETAPPSDGTGNESNAPSAPGASSTPQDPSETTAPAETTAPSEPSAPSAPAAPTTPSGAATFPKSPISVRKNEVVTLQSSSSAYFVVVPEAYDASHNTASSLFIWLHGCGGTGSNDARVVSPGGSQSWVTVSVGGREGGCWNMETDSKLVLDALDDVSTRLNIDPRRVTIGGYSSGGNLAYRTAFYNARRFAGVLAENTAAFYGTGSTEASSIAAAAWKLNIVHLAHVSDTTFKMATVQSETAALAAAGFPVTLLEQPGSHWDSATNKNLQTYLLPYLDAGWRSPE